MPPIDRIFWSSAFKRAYKRRVLGTEIEKAFRGQLERFATDPFSPLLKTHKLSGVLQGTWAFSVSHDCRVIFEFLPGNAVLLIDIGSHDDVY